MSECYKYSKDSTLLKLPAEGEVMKFKNFKNMLERPYICYFDTDCASIRTNGSNTIATQRAVAACFY